MRKRKDWLTRNQDKLADGGVLMSTGGLLFQRASTVNKQEKNLSVLV